MGGRHLLYESRVYPGQPGYAKAVNDDLKQPRDPGVNAQLQSMHFNSLRREWERLVDEKDPEALQILRKAADRRMGRDVKGPRHSTEGPGA